jgi:hypothetical protein
MRPHRVLSCGRAVLTALPNGYSSGLIAFRATTVDHIIPEARRHGGVGDGAAVGGFLPPASGDGQLARRG